MNIYDKKKITQHEKARRFVNMKFQDQIGWAVPKHVRDPLNAYINQQEKKDERAKKVEELLELYKSVHGVVQSWDTMPDVQDKINKLEKELREIK